MRNVLYVAIIFVGLKCTLNIKIQPPEDRLTFLKRQLAAEIQKSQHSPQPNLLYNINPPQPQMLRNPITPVTRRRRKKLATRTPTRFTYKINKQSVTNDSLNIHTIKPLRTKHKLSKSQKWARHVAKFGKPQEVFYRREFLKLSDVEMKKRHAMLCVDLLRPVLAGLKKNSTVTKIVGEQTANRLIQLLSYGNVQAPEEIESLLYQINSLHIRFFQWDVTAIKKFFNFIMPGQRHSFKSMKYGVKRIFEMWNMDLSNATMLIRESRMFRPPCIGTTEGSTRSSRGTRYTKPATPKSTCAPKDKKCLVHASSSFEDD